jgi:hypothetical protein
MHVMWIVVSPWKHYATMLQICSTSFFVHFVVYIQLGLNILMITIVITCHF